LGCAKFKKGGLAFTEFLLACRVPLIVTDDVVEINELKDYLDAAEFFDN